MLFRSDSSVLGLAMETNMKATLCEHTLDNANLAYPNLVGAILHSDRGTQYTSETYRQALAKCGIIQSINSAGGRSHDNARCESMWARMKSELLYDRYNTETMTTEELNAKNVPTRRSASPQSAAEPSWATMRLFLPVLTR